MSNKVKDKDVKTPHNTFSMILSMQKILIRIKLK